VCKDAHKRRKGPNICEHGRVWSVCRQCGGGSICHHNRRRSVCKDCGGGGICQHGKQKTQCKACGGACVCAHGKQKSQCKECGGGSICPHDRVRSKCRECGGGSICRHKKRRSMCVECSAGSVCEHGKRKLMCKLCSETAVTAAAAKHNTLARDDYMRILLDSGSTLPAASATVNRPHPIHLPTASDSCSSMCAVASSWTNIEFLKILEASHVQGLNPFSFLHPFVSPMLLGVHPLLMQTQFTSAAALAPRNALQHAPAISGMRPT
jgi:hypothetical protein